MCTRCCWSGLMPSCSIWFWLLTLMSVDAVDSLLIWYPSSFCRCRMASCLLHSGVAVVLTQPVLPTAVYVLSTAEEAEAGLTFCVRSMQVAVPLLFPFVQVVSAVSAPLVSILSEHDGACTGWY